MLKLNKSKQETGDNMIPSLGAWSSEQYVPYSEYTHKGRGNVGKEKSRLYIMNRNKRHTVGVLLSNKRLSDDLSWITVQEVLCAWKMAYSVTLTSRQRADGGQCEQVHTVFPRGVFRTLSPSLCMCMHVLCTLWMQLYCGVIVSIELVNWVTLSSILVLVSHV